MPLPKFEYLKPETLDEAASILADYGKNAKILAGGTDLLPDLRGRMIRPDYVVDVKGISEMGELSYDEEEGLRIGGAVTLNKLIESEVVRENFWVLWSAIEQLADPIVRNRATLVGNICTASPAGDSSPPLLVLNADVEVMGEVDERTVPIRDFFAGVKRTSMGDKEFVKAVRIPTPPEGAVGDYLKWTRTRSEDLSIVGVAALVTDREDGILRIALSSVAPVPLYVPDAEDILKRKDTLDERVEEAVSAVKRSISPISDVRCVESYRKHMARILTVRILRKLLVEES